MKKSLLVIILASGLVFSCHKSSSSSVEATPVSAQATKALTVGTLAAPGQNSVELDSNVTAGGSMVFTYHADRTAEMTITPSSEVAVNCNLADLSTSIILNGPEFQNVALNLPQQIQVQSGEDYTIKLTLGPNSCMSFSFAFQAYFN